MAGSGGGVYDNICGGGGLPNGGGSHFGGGGIDPGRNHAGLTRIAYGISRKDLKCGWRGGCQK